MDKISPLITQTIRHWRNDFDKRDNEILDDSNNDIVGGTFSSDTWCFYLFQNSATEHKK